MRAYFFTNFYLSPIQQGIQPAHCIADMFVKYNGPAAPRVTREVLYDWAINHKTMICLNGGNNAELTLIAKSVSSLAVDLLLPHGCFREDEQSLGGIMTCFGVIVPERIYETAAMLRDGVQSLTDELGNKIDPYEHVSITEMAFAELLNEQGLAR